MLVCNILRAVSVVPFPLHLLPVEYPKGQINLLLYTLIIIEEYEDWYISYVENHPL